MLKITCLSIAVLMGALALINGTFMLVSPMGWYFAIPGVTTTGPFNQHFIRDIGLIFLFLGGLLLIGARRPSLRAFFWTAATTWLAAHALFHFWEIAAGLCTLAVIPRDFPAVTLPALLGLCISTWAILDTRERA